VQDFLQLQGLSLNASRGGALCACFRWETTCEQLTDSTYNTEQNSCDCDHIGALANYHKYLR